MHDACRDPSFTLPGLIVMQPDPTHSSRMPIGDVSIRPCSDEELPLLAALTAPGFIGLLAEGAGLEAKSGLCHLTIWIGDIPAGLLLSRQSDSNPYEQELISLMVLPLLRRQGLARRLLDEWKTRMVQAGRATLVAQWSDHLPRVQDFAALLANEQWDTPGRARLRMSFHVSDRHEALPYADRLGAHLQRVGIRIISLSDLAPAKTQAFDNDARMGVSRGDIPAWAAPGRWMENSDRAVSQLLLGADGSVQGWLLCQRQPALQRWTVPIGWASAAMPVRGVLVAAMARLLERLEAEHGPQSTLTLQPSMGAGAKVCALLDRRFRPHALWADRLLESRKRIA